MFTFAFLLALPFPSHADYPRDLHHDLRVSLEPSQRRLSGLDAIRVEAGRSDALELQLARNAKVERVMVEGSGRAFTFETGRLRVPILAAEKDRVIDVSVEYSTIFNDPIPEMPLNIDNPGYGVTGIISEKGTFLLQGAAWYPQIPGSRPTYKLMVEAPEGIVAVSAGKCLGHERRDGKTYSTWEVDFPHEGLALSAAPYLVQERTVNGIRISTYFFARTEDLSDAYLDATARYLVFYENLFGPYPFPGFSVVENFFPTGYGFPSYPLLGSAVIRLPFIIETSLGHEIAHCWWGNGVLVDHRQGNWCEGLTTYVADYLYKENSSAEEAKEYRLQILRDFSTLVNDDNDYPLARFQSRYDPASQAIGYGKGAMVFHMIRRKVGEKDFWKALRDLYSEKLFQKASWQDFQKAFERDGEWDLQGFFDQWVNRSGAPRLSLGSTATEPMKGLWKVRSYILQNQPVYDLEIPISLETDSLRGHKTVSLSGPAASFEVISLARPMRLVLDPEHHLFRVLDPAEIPPTVNSLKASRSLLIVLCAPWKTEGEKAAKALALSLGVKENSIIPENRLPEAGAKNHDLLYIGLPEGSPVPVRPVPGLRLEAKGFVLQGQTFNRPSDVFFGVFPHPETKDRVAAIYLPYASGPAEDVAGRITRYGKYSYLAFSDGKNKEKGTWPITDSPLIYTWNEE